MNRKRAEKLAAAGLRHVTGLPHDRGGFFQASRTCCGEFFCDTGLGGRTILFTKDGEVWIGGGYGCVNKAVLKRYAEDLTKIAHNRPFATHNYMARGDECSWHYYHVLGLSALEQRDADPYSDCGGKYSPIPHVRD